MSSDLRAIHIENSSVGSELGSTDRGRMGPADGVSAGRGRSVFPCFVLRRCAPQPGAHSAFVLLPTNLTSIDTVHGEPRATVIPNF